MSRTPGARNRNYAETRHRLAAAMAGRLLGVDGDLATFTELAGAAGVSPTTLKHYFGDREGAYAGALAAVAEDAGGYLRQQVDASLQEPSSAEAVRRFLEATVTAWRRHGLGAVFTGTLAWGVASTPRGAPFLDSVLEPIIEATAELVRELMEREGHPTADAEQVRVRALMVLSPVVLALLHQDSLGGRKTRPLEMSQLITAMSTRALA